MNYRTHHDPVGNHRDIQIHPTALLESDCIGAGSRIDAFARVMQGAVVGNQSIISDHVVVEPDVIIGSHVNVGQGVRLCSGLRVEDEVRIGPNVAFADDASSGLLGETTQPVTTLLKRGAVVGPNATIHQGVTVGARAQVESGAVVFRDVPTQRDRRWQPGTHHRLCGHVQRRDRSSVGELIRLTPTSLCPRCARRGRDWSDCHASSIFAVPCHSGRLARTFRSSPSASSSSMTWRRGRCGVNMRIVNCSSSSSA